MFGIFLALLTTAAVAADAPAPSTNQGVVHIDTSKPGFTVGVIDQRGTAVSSGGYTAQAVFTRDLCIAPCSFEAQPGLIELFAHKKGKLARPYTVQVQPGETRVSLEPGSAALYTGGTYMMYTGALLAVTGGVFLAMDGSLPTGASAGMLGGGLALTGGGVALRISNKGKWTVAPAR